MFNARFSMEERRRESAVKFQTSSKASGAEPGQQ